jgi:ATP-dependent RNA circularization protein (DNA/RNA ligase family)
VTTDFFRFPQTPHIAWLGKGMPRDDKVLSADEGGQLLAGEVAVEEKLDGANLGFSLAPDGVLRAQNRGQYLAHPHAGQFARLADWMDLHGDTVHTALALHADAGLMLFGEWCAARHSLDYTALPDWFLLFDVYERQSGRFWNSTRRNALAAECGLVTVPTLFRGQRSLADLRAMLETVPSRYRSGTLEGVVVRQESAQWCEARAKLVRPDFTQTIAEHWSRRRLEWNRLDWGSAAEGGEVPQAS